MNFITTRCDSTYHFIPNDKDGKVLIIRCGLEGGHDSIHTGRTVAGLTIHWTDDAAESSRKHAHEYTLRKLLEEQERERAKERARREKTTAKIRKTVYGWRVWTRRYGGRILSSLNGARWDGPSMTVNPTPDRTALRRVHWRNNPGLGQGLRKSYPTEDHGLYSYKSPVSLLRYFHAFESKTIGRVRVLGHTVVHEIGYRSQQLVVDELWLPYSGSSLGVSTLSWGTAMEGAEQTMRDAMEKRYQCPVHFIPMRRLQAWAEYYASEYPTPPELEADDG